MFEGITLNGKPLTAEKFRKSRRSPSARSGNGRVVFAKGQRETHVIFAGGMFPWAEKADYVRSGHSILGGLEYDEKQDKVKCHECGEWFQFLGNTHLRSHGMSSVEYRRDHLLRWKTPLGTPAYSAMRKRQLTPHGMRTRRRPGCRSDFRRNARSIGVSMEFANLNSRCAAQLENRVRALYADLGRTPTIAELIAAGLNPATLSRVFGKRLREVFLSMGMPVRRRGVHGKELFQSRATGEQ